MAKSMDLLKAALAERQAKAKRTIEETGKKWVKRGDLEQKRREEYLENQRLEEERAKAEEEERLKRFSDHLSKSAAQNAEANMEIDARLVDIALLDDDDAEPPLALGEVIDRLRGMGCPITLFGETDMQRYKRLRQIEKEAHEGKKNPDLLMLEQVHLQQRQLQQQQDEDDDQEADKEEQAEPEVADDKSDSEDDSDDIAKKEAGNVIDSAPSKEPEPDAPPIEVEDTVMDKCDFIRAWARKALKAWEKELADKPDEEKAKQIVKTEIAAHRQVRRDVRPLQKRLRVYAMDDFLLDKIYTIVKFAAELEYRNASEAYLDLSIGKAAWPVGIGCGGSMLMEDAIGLHDRFNRNNQVKDIAFALNDDVTRKYVQALKRLMNVAKKYWPPEDPSKL